MLLTYASVSLAAHAATVSAAFLPIEGDGVGVVVAEVVQVNVSSEVGLIVLDAADDVVLELVSVIQDSIRLLLIEVYIPGRRHVER